jgi:hypothetical protein
MDIAATALPLPLIAWRTDMKILGIRLTNEDAADIVHCAIEGGTNYWAECRNYNWQEWYDGDNVREDLPDDYVFVEIREDEELVDPELANVWLSITRHNLEKGVIALIEHHPHLIHGVSNRGGGDVEFDFDATSCDVIFQYAVFGKVVYG